MAVAKAAVVRATWLYPIETPLPNKRPTRLKLQRIAGALSLLIEATEPLIATEPPEPARIRPEEPCIIGGDPGSGKSALASQIVAENARLGRAQSEAVPR